jgi:hypothetical protein
MWLSIVDSVEKYGAQFLDLLATLRTNDFQEPVAKAKPTIQKLHATYQTTLTLIEQNETIENICQQRDLTLSTYCHNLLSISIKSLPLS